MDTQNPMLFESKLDEAALLAMIGEASPEAEQQDDWLLWKQHTLRLKVAFGEVRRIDSVFRVQLLFIARHPWFDEDLVISQPCFAPDPEQAIRSGVRDFIPCDTLITALGLIPERKLVRGLEDRDWLALAGNCRTVHDIVDSAAAEGEKIGRMAGGMFSV